MPVWLVGWSGGGGEVRQPSLAVYTTAHPTDRTTLRWRPTISEVRVDGRGRPAALSCLSGTLAAPGSGVRSLLVPAHVRVRDTQAVRQTDGRGRKSSWENSTYSVARNNNPLFYWGPRMGAPPDQATSYPKSLGNRTNA